MTLYGVSTEYEHSATHSRQRLTVWSGAFMSTWEAEARATPGARQITLTTYNGDKVRVQLPEGVTAPRSEANYQAFDQAISDALNAYERKRGSVKIGEAA